jgi:hypothetical protein
MYDYRMAYRDDRVLLDLRRILTLYGLGQVVHLTEADLEMMRNMCQYLHRRSTWCFEYEQGFYYAADDGDFDTIEALVSGLEDKLMPTSVDVWGYTDTVELAATTIVSGPGPLELVLGTVPANTVWRLLTTVAVNANTSCVQIRWIVRRSGTDYIVYTQEGPTAAVWYSRSVDLVCASDDQVIVWFASNQAGDTLIANALGYAMSVG